MGIATFSGKLTHFFHAETNPIITMKSFSLPALLLFLCTFAANAQWTTSGSNVYLTTSGNRVGIGLTAPAAKLHVASTNEIARMQTSSNIGYINFYSNTTARIGYIGMYNSGYNMDFGTGTTNPNGKTHLVTLATPRLTVVSNGWVGINTTAPSYRLDVRESAANNTGAFFNSSTFNGEKVALFAEVTTTSAASGEAIAVKGISNNGFNGIGGSFEGSLFSGRFTGGEVSISSNTYHALHVECTAAEAGYFQSSGGHGIIAGTSKVGSYAGYFNGKVYASAGYTTSDERFKQKIQPMRNALDKIKLLKPSTYEFNQKDFAFMNLPEGNQIGLLAQDLERVFPELIGEVETDRKLFERHDGAEHQPHSPADRDEFKFKAVNYVGLIPVLIAGIQEQQAEMDVQRAEMDAKDSKIAELETRLSRMEKLVESLVAERAAINTENTKVESIAANQLLGNRPNPFVGTTTVDFDIAPAIRQAELVILSPTGQVIRRVSIEGRGKGSIEVSMPNSMPGVYTYTIVADGLSLPAQMMTLVGAK